MIKKDERLPAKINSRFLTLTIIAIVCTMALSTFVYYEIFKEEIIQDLESYANILKDNGIFDNPDDVSELNLDNSSFRITLVGEDGMVVYDNVADAASLESHNDRPEIEEAFEEGQGTSVRMSETLNKSTFYYAVKLDNGCVLRLSKETDSILSVFASGLPIVILIILILAAAVVIITHFLTKSIVKPIEQMANDLDHIDNIRSYKEIRPFIDTIQKQHQDILKNAQMRQDFTANVSHELKTPLTSISGYSELIENGMAGEDDVQRFAREIHRNSNRLLTLINDIIRLSELDVTENKPEMEKLDFYKLTKNNVDMLRLNADKHSVTLNMSGNTAYITANKMMMEELVYNLVDNAIRYNNENGKVFVSVYNEEDKVYLKVKDTGIGIPKEHQDLIFQRFYRVDKSRSKETGGTGLGLAIVKHIVAQHNAEIEISSTPGAGTEIVVIFDEYKE